MRRFERSASPLSAVIAVFALMLAVSPAWAQTWPRRDVQGVVVDASTGRAIGGAWIELADGGAGVYTDADGRFVLRDVRIGTVALKAEQLGYTDFAEERTIADEGSLRIALQPDPVVLKGIKVVTDRLEARRNSIPYGVRAWDSAYMLSTSAADAYDFVKLNTFTRPCGFSTCIYRRGRLTYPAVFIDEVPYIGGLDNLHGLPIEHLYLIELIGSQVRVYTKGFTRRLAMHEAPLMPVLSGGMY